MSEKNDLSNKKPVYKKWWFWVIIVLVIAAVGGSASNSQKTTTLDTTQSASSESQEGNTETTPTLGNTITFSKLEITFSKEYSFVTLDNQFSDKNGSTVIKLPVTVKNVSSEKNSLNMFFFKAFGASGTELDDVSSYFNEDAIDFAGELKPGASYESNFYVLYDGDGKYSIDFDNYSEKVSVEFDVKK